MQREECEQLLIRKLKEMVDVYLQYNPDGKYLCLGYLRDEDEGTFSLNVNNSYWPSIDGDPAGDDVDLPINTRVQFELAGPLTIEEMLPAFSATTRRRIKGFTGAELELLRKLKVDGEEAEMMDAVLDILNKRNKGLGTTWHNGIGVYGVSFYEDSDTVILITGKSCD